MTNTIEMISLAFKTDTPVMLWGAPGVGKSDMVREAAARSGLPVIDVRLPLLEPTDLRGLPHVVDGVATWSRPEFLPVEGSDYPDDCVLFLDEINAADLSTQKAAYQLTLDRKIGDHVLKPGVRIAAAGNRQADRTGATAMPTALANRFMHLQVEPDAKAWAQWAITNGVDPIVVAAVRFRSDLIHVMPEKGQNAFPSPRSWAKLGQVWSMVQGSQRYAYAEAIIGEGAASELRAFVTMAEELPSISDILAAPDTTPIPANIESRVGLQFALAVGIAAAVDADTIGNGLAYLSRLRNDEFEMLAAMDAVARDPSLKHTKAFVDVMLKVGKAYQ